jgi:alpha-1,2-mannosyltransferase
MGSREGRRGTLTRRIRLEHADEGRGPMVLARPGTGQTSGGRPQPGRPHWVLPAAAAACVLSLAAWVAVASGCHLLSWFDLAVYNHGGLLARTDQQRLYSWQLRRGIKFTYPPFAALVFAVGSVLPWAVLKWLMTVASLAALAASIWLTLGALGRSGRARVTATLGFTAVALCTEPVQHGLDLGQIELLLMVLIVWDLCQPDRRRWKGAGVGIAAGIKLIPLVYIPYLLFSGKLRQAAVASATFAGTVVAGFAFLPDASVKYWLTGYFLHPRNVGNAGSLLNQSLLGMFTRADGSGSAAMEAYLALAALIAALGVTAAAMLDRSGRHVAGWVTCALTGLLVSPISWDHHWVWVVPVMVLLVDVAVRSRGGARWAFGALAAAVAAVYGGWPFWSGRFAGVPHSLVGFFSGPPPHEIYYPHGMQVISWNLFVVAGLVMFAFALVAAARAWQPRSAAARGDAAVT